MSTINYEELTGNQKFAFNNIKHAANWCIGGLENSMQDNPEDSDEYKAALKELTDHEGLVEYVYDEGVSNMYGEGFCGFGPQYKKQIQQIKFCGKEWLMRVAEQIVTELGY